MTPPSMRLFKMSSSINNMLMLGIVLFSVFLIYRYVKSLETEVKVLADKFNTLQYDLTRPIIMSNDNKCDSSMDNYVLKNTEKQEDIIDNDNDTDNDTDSVKSEDILKLIDEIQNNDLVNDDATEDPEKLLTDQQKQNDENESFEQVANTNNEVLEEDDIVLKKTFDTEDVSLTECFLVKKTNEELRVILKTHGKNTKGPKSELIKRILED